MTSTTSLKQSPETIHLHSSAMDRLPPEIRLRLYELLAEDSLLHIQALHSVNRAFHDLYTHNEGYILRHYAERYIDEGNLDMCRIFVELPSIHRENHDAWGMTDEGMVLLRRVLEICKSEANTSGVGGRFAKMDISRLKDLIRTFSMMRFLFLTIKLLGYIQPKYYSIAQLGIDKFDTDEVLFRKLSNLCWRPPSMAETCFKSECDYYQDLLAHHAYFDDFSHPAMSGRLSMRLAGWSEDSPPLNCLQSRDDNVRLLDNHLWEVIGGYKSLGIFSYEPCKRIYAFDCHEEAFYIMFSAMLRLMNWKYWYRLCSDEDLQKRIDILQRFHSSVAHIGEFDAGRAMMCACK